MLIIAQSLSTFVQMDIDSAWQRGQRCPYCQGVAKLDLEFIRSEFIKEGYILLSKEYIGTHSKLDYICPKGHIGTIQWTNWSQGKRCFTLFWKFKKDYTVYIGCYER